MATDLPAAQRGPEPGKGTPAAVPAAVPVPGAAAERPGYRPAITAVPPRSAAAASRKALAALVRRDLAVLRKHLVEFVARTLVQPFLLVFVFLYIFPTIGQGVGGGAGGDGESTFATVLVPGVVGIAIMFQGIQAVAMVMAQEFGFTREIEDRVQAPCPLWLVAVAKVLSGAAQGLLAALIVFPMAYVVHARDVEVDLTVHWGLALTLMPLFSVMMSSLGLVLGTKFEARNIGLMFGFVVLPVTFLGGTYYAWTSLAPVTIGSFHWLQALVLVNPLIYVNEGLRAAFTTVPHMHLYVIYPVAVGLTALFLAEGIRGFRKRVLS